MYSIHIDDELMEQLYQVLEARKAGGEKKTTIKGLVREAIERLVAGEPQDGEWDSYAMEELEN